jgi:septal ring factor EnvC (AmiA/AmiB activator)
MKFSTILWIRFVPVLLASGLLLVAGCSNKDAELAAERQKELETVRSELEQAKNAAAAQETELTRLRKDNLELLRLRNEVRQLRDDKKQLSQQAQSAQVQAQQAQIQAQAVQSQAQQAAQALAAQSAANTCINNLRQIDGAMQQWALVNKKDANAIPTARDIAPYLKNILPKCPAGGTYTFNSVGVGPTCTIPGHALPR